MNIIIAKKQESRLEDGINEILSLDYETFEEIIRQLTPHGKNLEDIHFFYTTDKCENPSAHIQLGLEKVRDDKGRYIGRSYYGGELNSISDIFQRLNDKLKDLDKESKEYIRTNRLLETRNLESFKTIFCENNRM